MRIARTLATPASPAWSLNSEEALLIGMLWHYSPSGAERALSEWLCAHLHGSALRLEVDAVGNFIAELPATVETPEPPVVLLGHLDTVPGYIRVRREDGRLYGRGAVDAKGPLAAFIAATQRLTVSDVPRSRPVIVVGAVEEEAATSRGARAALERWRPAYTIIGEPSSASALTLGYKGRLLVSYRIERPVAHTARPEESACARTVAFWQTVQQAAEEWNTAHVQPLSPANYFAALMPSLRSINSGSDSFSGGASFRLAIACRPITIPQRCKPGWRKKRRQTARRSPAGALRSLIRDRVMAHWSAASCAPCARKASPRLSSSRLARPI
jgi:acetylornithine deacetylase/succinyl-diaminopimelate desuccinylase-like protein